jgi:TetR/AcrR family transcriptional repressor of bet genes
MPKVGMEPIRRRQLIEATITAIHDHGFADTTVSRISALAGLSSGIIHHYFGGKNELLEATMRALLNDLRTAVADGLARASGPRERVDAVIDANFAPGQFTPQVVIAWLAFWAQAPMVPALARLQRINAARLNSNLRHALAQLVPAPAARRIASGLAAMIDGLWLRCALTQGGIDADEARGLARRFCETELARESPG